MTFAIIKTGGKQYKVAEGDVLNVEKLPSSAGSGQAKTGEAVFEKVLLSADAAGEIKVGKPLVSGAKVFAKILEEGRGKKKMVFRYKSKTRQHKKKGHRQPYAKIQITKIAP